MCPDCEGTGGSSPLARGTLRRQMRQVLTQRFIPARAGNTGCWTSCAASGTVHPRSRGEHPRRKTRAEQFTGSSPLARGTPAPAEPLNHPPRFIPARAGNTLPAWTMARPTSVHPRSRGEHVAQGDPTMAKPGSSPLARGTQFLGLDLHVSRRFIPARAGNTASMRTFVAFPPVHPRSRGEHCSVYRSAPSCAGSSPLARGTRQHRRPRRASGRFIPARAGNTTRPGARAGPSPVHPRSRGEHLCSVTASGEAAGSSPLARGTLVAPSCHENSVRFIPARAGNTGNGIRGTRCRTVHPRSRGEHRYGYVRSSARFGSSPLARGTRRHCPVRRPW